MNKLTISLIILGLIVVVVTMATPFGDKEISNLKTADYETAELYDLASASSTVSVAGVVTAADSVIVTAKTNGVLNGLAVVEGSTVGLGSLVATQDTPVANAQVVYQNALSEQMTAEQNALVDARVYAAEKSSVLARSAEEIAVIQTEASKTQLQAQLSAVRNATEAGIVTMLDVLSFVNDNPSLFSDTRREQFQEIVNDLYDGLPGHFSSPVEYGNDLTSADILSTLEAMREIDTESLSVVDTETLGVVAMGQLRALITLYTTAESDVLDRDKVDQGGTTYTTYFANRVNIVESLSALEAAEQALQSNVDSLSETEVTTGQNIQVTDIDETLAKRQADFSEAIAAAANKAAAAATSVAAAEASLGVVLAPFRGVVSSVYVEVGDYLRAGEPIFVLHGSGARELAVSAPVAIGTQLRIGDTFLVAGEVAGVIDRLNPAQLGHSVEVFISLSDTSLPVGSSLKGELAFAVADTESVLPREYVFFNSNGPFVRTLLGKDYPVEIVLDNGGQFVVTFPAGKPGDSLIPSRSVTF